MKIIRCHVLKVFILFLDEENFYFLNKNFLNEKLLYKHSTSEIYIFPKENLLLFFEIVNISQIKGDELIKNCFATVSLDRLKEYLVDYLKLLKKNNLKI